MHVQCGTPSLKPNTVEPVFHVTLSRTKLTFLWYINYFTGTSHLREENLVPWGHVKYRFHCTSIWFCYSDNHAVMAKSFK